MTKLKASLILRGESFRDNFFIQKEKLGYLMSRIFPFFYNSLLTMGESLRYDVFAVNSYDLFFCRKSTADLHIISDSYEFNVRILFEELAKKSQFIVDIGANVGKYAVVAGRVNPSAEVYAFEPAAENLKILKKNKELNKSHNLIISPIAISKDQRKMRLYEGLGTGGASLKVKSSRFDEVDVSSLDNLFRGKIIDLIKIDTEGSELDVIFGARD